GIVSRPGDPQVGHLRVLEAQHLQQEVGQAVGGETGGEEGIGLDHGVGVLVAEEEDGVGVHVGETQAVVDGHGGEPGGGGVGVVVVGGYVEAAVAGELDGGV